MTDYGPLLLPPKETSWKAGAIDFLSWAFPAVAALISIAAGVAALLNANAWAAILGIIAGVSGACGIAAANLASRIRDDRLERTYLLASRSLEIADEVDRRGSPQF